MPGLRRADDQGSGLCFCVCPVEETLAYTGQKDCPWCGCGWLWSCYRCGKAFSVAQDGAGNRWCVIDEVAVPVEDAPQMTELGREALACAAAWRRGDWASGGNY